MPSISPDAPYTTDAKLAADVTTRGLPPHERDGTVTAALAAGFPVREVPVTGGGSGDARVHDHGFVGTRVNKRRADCLEQGEPALPRDHSLAELGDEPP